MICAFDIGIKNLSYCIMTGDDKKKYIIGWSLIDLRTPKKMCSYEHDGISCSKPADFCCKSNENNAFCKKHKEQYKYIPHKPIECSSEHICEYDGCDKQCSFIFREKYYCKQHCKKMCASDVSENKLISIKKIGCMKEPLYDVGTHLYDELRKHPEMLCCDRIVIENQPSMTNPTMKSISMLLFSYFVMLRHRDVEFISPSGKLKINDILTKTILNKCPKGSIKYAMTKDLGEVYCKELLKHVEKSDLWRDKLDKCKKQDDMCDAFLHAWYHQWGSGLLDDKEFISQTSQMFDDAIKKRLDNKKKRDDKKKHNDNDTIKLDN